MMLFIKRDTSPGSPFPEVSSDGFRLPRGVSKSGGPPIAAHLPKNLVFSVTDGAPESPGLTDYMEGVGWIVVSSKLRTVLDRHGAEVEYIDLPLRYQGALHQGYFLANPRHAIKGVDMAASKIELDEVGIALTVDRLVLDESRFAGIPLAMLDETADLAVSADLADSIRAAGCTGCKFVAPEAISF